MKEVKCEKTGKVYGLALGPAIMVKLEESYVSLYPPEVIELVKEYAENNGLPAEEVLGSNEHIIKAMSKLDPETDQEIGKKIRTSKNNHLINILKSSIKTINGDKVEDIEFEMEVMEIPVFKEIRDIVNEAYREFQSGLGDESGESEPLSGEKMGLEEASV